MNKLIKISTISLFTFASIASFSTTAVSGSINEMMAASKDKIACSADCNADYGQCVGSATDLSLTSSAADILPRTKSNLMAGNECNTAVMQCYSAC